MSAVISLPNRAQPFVVTVSALYAAAIVVGVLTTQVTASNVTSFAVLVGCALVSIEGSLRLVWSGPKAGRSTNDLLAVWTIPVVLLLPPLYGALVVGAHIRVLAAACRQAPARQAAVQHFRCGAGEFRGRESPSRLRRRSDAMGRALVGRHTGRPRCHRGVRRCAPCHQHGA